MKIYILTEAGKKIGFGHLTRCLALYHAAEAKGQTPELIVNGDASIAGLLKKTRYRVFDWLHQPEKVVSGMTPDDAVILDSYLAPKAVYDVISEKVSGRLAMIDDFNRLDYPAGIVINPSVYGGTMHYQSGPGKRFLLGKEYIILRKEFWNVSRKKISRKIKKILVTFGGTDCSALITRIVKHLKALYSVEYAVVDARRRYSASEMRGLMLDSDISISAAGQTTNELARVGLPSVTVCCAQNQQLNAAGWQKAGFSQNAGWHTDKDLPAKIEAAIKKLAPFEERLKRSTLGRELVDGKGASRIIDQIVHGIISKDDDLRLRVAEERDCRDLWMWRNHPEVRKWCTNTNKIEYSEHARWFKKNLNDERTRLYVAETADNKKIGQIRFDMIRGAKKSQINVNLNPAFFGKGLGSKLIQKASRRFLKDTHSISEIRAEVLSDNQASRKAFLKAGYVLCGKPDLKKRSMDVFRYVREKNEK